MKTTTRLRLRWRGLGTLVLAMSLICAGLAARPAQADDAVPWVSAMEGKPDTLSLRHEGDEWFQATLNTPITKGDDLYLEAGGRAEIFLNGSSYIRLSGPASLRFDTLQADSFDVAQNMGQAQFQTGPDTEVFLVTPTLGITIHANTRARLNVAEDESTEVTTLRGQVELNGPSGYAAVNAGQSLYLGARSSNYNLSAAPPPDDFDQWSERRDRKLAATPPTPAPVGRYLPPPAASDLSSNGQWYNDPGYGWVWRPSVSLGWSPYTVGHWGWWPGWGWTWISYESWGWYPYHYGNWVVGGAGWFWVPGPIVSVGWSPSLVFWLDGPDWIGWCPLPFGVDVITFRRDIDRDPHLVYNYVQQNNITVVNVNNFNTTNYTTVRRSLPADYRTVARPATDSRHEFRGIHNVRDFETASPKGRVAWYHRPPERVTNRVAPAWEPDRGKDRGLRQGQNQGERPERVIERPLPPGRGADRTPPARREKANEPHGRGPGEVNPPGQLKERPEAPGHPGRGPGDATPPGQLKERPEAPGHPGREKGIETPTGPGKERPDRPTPPGRGEKSSNPPSGEPPRGPEVKPPERVIERPLPPGRGEKSSNPPAGGTPRGPEVKPPERVIERPLPPGRGEKSSNPPSGGTPRGPEVKPPERATPPSRAEQPSGGPGKERSQSPSPPSRQPAPAAPAPQPPKAQHVETPSRPSGGAPAAPAPEPNKPSNKKKKGAFLYSPPGRETRSAESPAYLSRASRETAIPRFTPQGGWGRGDSPASSKASRTQLSRNETNPGAFSRPNFGSQSRSGGSATPSFHSSSPKGSFFSPAGANREPAKGSSGRSSVFHSSGSNGTKHKGR